MNESIKRAITAIDLWLSGEGRTEIIVGLFMMLGIPLIVLTIIGLIFGWTISLAIVKVVGAVVLGFVMLIGMTAIVIMFFSLLQMMVEGGKMIVDGIVKVYKARKGKDA